MAELRIEELEEIDPAECVSYLNLYSNFDRQVTWGIPGGFSVVG